eukprot:7479204-Pyramimonas_sp.AAC.1
MGLTASQQRYMRALEDLSPNLVTGAPACARVLKLTGLNRGKRGDLGARARSEKGDRELRHFGMQ